MSILEEHHVALPALYGAPAYARPPRIVPEEQRPPDPDDLPLEAFQTVEEREIAAAIGRPDGGAASDSAAPASRHPGGLLPRPFRLRSLGRIVGSNS